MGLSESQWVYHWSPQTELLSLIKNLAIILSLWSGSHMSGTCPMEEDFGDECIYSVTALSVL